MDKESGGISDPIGYPDRNGLLSYPEGLFIDLASTWGQNVNGAGSAPQRNQPDLGRIEAKEGESKENAMTPRQLGGDDPRNHNIDRAESKTTHCAGNISDLSASHKFPKVGDRPID